MRRLALAFLFLVALTVPASALFSLSGFRNTMIEFLIDQLSTEGVFEITVEEIQDTADGATSIRGLTIADAEGVWFRADALDFAWDSGRLTSGEVVFQELAMRGVSITRRPIVPPSDDAEAEPEDPNAPLIPEIAWPRSPLTLRVDRLLLEGVSLGQPVLGHAMAFNAEGSLIDEGDVQAAQLTIARTDQVMGQIALSYERVFTTATLAVDLTVEEGAGGVIPALSGLPEDAATTLTLTAQGPPQDWRVALDLSLADTVAATGQATIAYQGPLNVDARVQVQPGPQLDPQIATLLGDQAAIIVNLSEGEDTTIQINEARITSPDFNLAAEGTFTRSTAAADLALDLRAGSRLAEPFDGVDFGGLGFVGRLTGAPGSFAALGDLTIDGLETGPTAFQSATLRVDVSQITPQEPQDTAATAQTRTDMAINGIARALRLDRITAEVVGDAEIALSASLTGSDLRLSQLALSSDPLNVVASGTADIESQTADLDLSLSAPQIAPVTAAYGIEVEGGIAGSANVTRSETGTLADLDIRLVSFRHPLADAQRLAVVGAVTEAEGAITYQVAADARRLRLDRIGPDLLPTARVTADGTFQENVLDLTLAQLISPLLNVRASGTFDTAQMDGAITYDVATPQLGPVAAVYDVPLDGVLGADGQVTVNDGILQIVGRAALAGLTFDNVAYGRVDLAHDVEIGAAPAGTVEVTTTGGPYGTARVATGFVFDAPLLTLSGLDAAALGLRAAGDLAIATDGPLVDGRLDLGIDDLAALRPVVGTDLAGRGAGDLTLSATDGKQAASLNLRLSGVRAADARVAQARLQARLADVLGTPAVQASLNASGVSSGGIELSTVQSTVRGPLSGLALTADVAGQLGEDPINLALAATANVGGPDVRARVMRLDASLAEERISLNAPLQITSRGGTTALQGIDIALPDRGRILGNVTSFGGPVAGDLQISAPDLGVLQRLADVPLTQGGVEMQASFDTRRARATATITGTAVRFEGVDAGQDLDLAARLDWAGRSAAVEAEVSGNFGQPISLQATLPIAVQGGLPGLASSGPIDGALRWQGEVGRFWALVPAPGHVLTGQADIDLGVSGDISAPALTGRIGLTDGGYQNLDLGTILTDLTVGTELGSDGDLRLRLEGSDGADGRVSVDGRLALDASGLDIATRLDRAVLVRRDDALARIDGDIAVRGPMTALAVTGDLTITEAEIRLVNANPPSIVTLGDVEIKGAPPPEQDDSGSTVSLNLDVAAPGRVFVRGRGLDSEWQLNLAIRGNAAEPRISGRIERVRGVLSLIGKDFDLTRGRIDFDGGPVIDPQIDVVLARDTGDLVGRIVVDGPASAPELSFTSTPSLPEDEVLPRTLFGKSSQALSGSQALSLALGMATLMDGGGGTLDKVRGAVGLDQLRIEEDARGNAAIGLGKEVAEGVWVGTRQSLGGDGGTSVSVEVEVFEDIELEAEIEGGGGTSVGVQWKRDF
ncbi:MAG: translocation/assembly module TamB domain-containing protein [Pseudomonadota bacterium]